MFEINIDVIKSCVKHNIGLDEYVSIMGIYNKSYISLPVELLSRKCDTEKALFMQKLIRKGFITCNIKDPFEVPFSFSNYSITELGDEVVFTIDIVDNNKDKKVDEDFIKKYNELFPVGKNGGNKVMRTHPKDLENRMKQFMTKYGDSYTQEVILKATENFIKKFRGDYTYCPTSLYFIKKENTSALAAECEAIMKGNIEIIRSNITRF